MRLSLLHTVPGGASSSLYCSQSLLYSFYVVLLSVNFLLLLNINTAALAPCHIFNRRNITWPHILSVITNPFLSDKHIWPLPPSATLPFGLQKFRCVLLPCHRTTLFTEIATNTRPSPPCCYYHDFDTYPTEGIALTRYELWEIVSFAGDTCSMVDYGKRASEQMVTENHNHSHPWIWRRVKIVKWTCDTGCGALTNDESCGGQGLW